jgi:hypothetical protein
VQEGFDELYNHAIVTAGVTPTHASVHTIVAPPERELVSPKRLSRRAEEGELVYQLQCENTVKFRSEHYSLGPSAGDVIYQTATRRRRR